MNLTTFTTKLLMVPTAVGTGAPVAVGAYEGFFFFSPFARAPSTLATCRDATRKTAPG